MAQKNVQLREDCSKFPINNLVKDTVKFALECGGEETLGLKSRKVFHARYLNQAQFNNLFKKAVTTSFEIRIEYTTFTEIAMPFLTNAKRPRSARDRLFVIRENYDLKSINIPKSTFDVTEPFHVEIDSNPVLDEATLKRFRENCRAKLNKDCDIFEADRKCL
ncbi:hypothetical protein Y032_0180g799 [Ancylostoma ceylanicum]|uniref:Uncharacterized protein n=1 Tax=Ancylostoma ceylanicum TaxID=53326 RepID=A0A016STA2_9BILA|nr:hypothetical protein Y032_0180g799 [Ancylostoma ceylanicum]